MNGQSYETVVPKPMNGTSATPSSNSYPVELRCNQDLTEKTYLKLFMNIDIMDPLVKHLYPGTASISSSQSSRDGSPSRLVQSNNYINSTGSHHNTSNGQSQYKYPTDQNTNSSHLEYNQSGDSYGPGMYPPNSVGQVAKSQAKVTSPLTNYSSSRPILPSNPSQNSNAVPQKPEYEDPVYSNIGPGLINNYQKKPPTPSFNYPDQKSDTLSQDGYIGDSPKSPTSGSYPSNYPTQNYSNQQPPQNNTKQRDQPISSGPPRTNALGIIPYSNEGVTTVARSTVSTGLISPQSNSTGTNSSPNTTYPTNNASYSNSQQPPTLQTPHSVQPTQSYSQPTPAQSTGYSQQQGYTQSSYNSQVSQQSYSQQTYSAVQSQQQQYTQQYNSQQTQQAYSQQTFNSQPYTQQGYPQQLPTSYPQQTQSYPQQSLQYTSQQQSYLPNTGYYQQNAYTNLPTSGTPITGYQSPQSNYPGYPPQSSANYTSQSYPRVSTAPVQPLRPSYQQGYNQVQGHYRDDLTHQMSNLSVTQAGFNQIWGQGCVDLLKTKDVLPTTKVEPPPIRLQQDFLESSNCSPELFRCTLTKIPETKSLLEKSRLPLGVLIHPFKDLNQLSVIQCSVIVRCKSCRTYINPFVYFVDAKHWKCNLCYRVNELPEEFQYDPLSKTYGDPSRRPEIKSATIEFIAPSEYMVRPPQPAAYVFVLDVSRAACESGYLQVACDTLLDQLEALPGDARTAIAFITFDSSVHYYSLAENQSQPHQMVVVDVDDMFVPSPDNLLVNLNECLFLVKDLLKELPNKFRESFDTGCALGAALQAAYKLLAPTGGRVTVLCSSLVNVGPGTLQPREDPTQRSGENITQQLLNPVTDFYKKQALDCSGQQIAVDLFILNSMFVDLATISGISRFSGGCMHHFPLFNIKNPHMVEMFHRTLHRYLCRKIGFESVMRLRCTRGLSIHTFHGNFFVRSTDLLSLPNINPDAGFGMQVSIDENLSDLQNVCFQAALLYTSSKGERRIRVHTVCLPIASNLSDVLHGADQQCIVGLLSKMAVDRCHQSSLSDAREAFVNVVSDVLSVYRLTQSTASPSSLMAPINLSLLPLYILALLKHTAFRIGQSTRLDDRVFAMCQMKTLSLSQLMQSIYPDLYPVHNLHEFPMMRVGDEDVVQPPRLHLSAERIDTTGMYLMDDGDNIILYVGQNLSPQLIKAIFDVPSFSAIDPDMGDLPKVNSQESEMLRGFINYLQNEKPVSPVVQVIRNDSPQRVKFLERLIEDKNESGHSYYEFLQNIKVFVK